MIVSPEYEIVTVEKGRVTGSYLITQKDFLLHCVLIFPCNQKQNKKVSLGHCLTSLRQIYVKSIPSDSRHLNWTDGAEEPRRLEWSNLGRRQLQ